MERKDFFEDLNIEQIQKNMAFGMKRMAQEARMRRNPVVIAKQIIDVDSGPPIFHNPILNELYIQDLNITEDTITKILSLPREELITDLVKIIYDSIFRHTYFSKPENKALNTWQLTHALFLLKELEAEEGLEAIIDFLSQDEDFLDFWLGDILTMEISMVILACGKNNLKRLSDFLKEPNRYTYSKSEVSEGVNQMAQHNIISREQAINWYSEIFEFFITNKENDDVIDTDLNGLMLGCVLDLNGEVLLPLIEKMFKLQLINREISGNWRETQIEIKRPQGRVHVKANQSMLQTYNDIKKWSGVSKNSEEENNDTSDDFEYERSLFQEPIVRSNSKIGRNDPCTCGSGKKYKKCCGTNS